MKYSKIIGTGSYLPSKVLTNYDLEKMVDTTNEWIVTRSGMLSHISEHVEKWHQARQQTAGDAL